MKLYSSFLLRCWVIRDEAEKIAPEKIVFDIEQIQTGEHRRTATPEEALQWILTACQNSQPDALETEPEEPDLQALPTGQPGQSL
jgi:hypothetical protein